MRNEELTYYSPAVSRDYEISPCPLRFSLSLSHVFYFFSLSLSLVFTFIHFSSPPSLLFFLPTYLSSLYSFPISLLFFTFYPSPFLSFPPSIPHVLPFSSTITLLSLSLSISLADFFYFPSSPVFSIIIFRLLFLHLSCLLFPPVPPLFCFRYSFLFPFPVSNLRIHV